MTILTYNDFASQAGLVESPLMLPSFGWMSKAYISMGNRLHGDNLNSDFTSLYNGAPNYTELASIPWTDIVGWTWIHPGAINTCTNSAVQVYDFQIQIFNINTNKWEMVSTAAAGRELTGSTWYDLSTTSISGGANDLIYSNRYNLQAFSTVKLTGDRAAAATIPGQESKFWATHVAVSRASGLDYSIIGGVVAMCRAKLVSVDGLPLNGVSKMMMNIGLDAYPVPNSTPNKGNYTTISSNIGASDTTIPVTSGAALPSNSTIKIDSETIKYTSINGNNMMGCVRGVNGTTAASHTSGANISGLLTNISIMPSMTISAFQEVTTTERVFLATTALLKTPSSEVIVQTTSNYQNSFPAGTYPQCMSSALFSQNVPQFNKFGH